VNLHVLTAVTRPSNLERVYDSIYSQDHSFWTVFWHLLHLDAPSVGGQKVKNLLLDATRPEDGWVYVLDDDTMMHPQFLDRTADVIDANPDCEVIFVGRSDHGNLFMPEVKVGAIDICQALIRRDLINDLRIPDLYDGDGWFLQALIDKAVEAVYLPESLSFYNLLR